MPEAAVVLPLMLLLPMAIRALLMVARPDASVETVNLLRRFCASEVVTVLPLKERAMADLLLS